MVSAEAATAAAGAAFVAGAGGASGEALVGAIVKRFVEALVEGSGFSVIVVLRSSGEGALNGND